MLLDLYILGISAAGAYTSKSKPFLSTYLIAFSKLLSKDTISTSILSLSISLYIEFMLGISATQGGHQVAQKLINTTLPLYYSIETFSPFEFIKLIPKSAFVLNVSTELAFASICSISGFITPVASNPR